MIGPHCTCKRCGERIEHDGGSLTYGYITLSAKKIQIGWSIQSAELCEECQISFQHWLDDPQYDNENYILKGGMNDA